VNLGRTVFAQLMEFLPTHQFQSCVDRYEGNRYVKEFSCWDQFLCLAFAQLTYRESLRDIEACLQTISNASVYAAGDAADTAGPPLTPVAGYEGRIAASNILEGNHRTADYRGIPTAAFTIPPLASVGLSEETARQQGLRFRTKHERTSNWYSSRRVGEAVSGYKVLIEEETDRILGAHLLGGQAEEVINLFALAIRSGIPAKDLKSTLFAYPSNSSDVPYML